MRPREFVLAHKVRHVICCFSGGRDSLVSTHYALADVADLNGVSKAVVHVDTTCALPGVQEYVRSVAELFGWPLHVLHPKVSFDDLARRWGMPTRRRRWCCYYLKLEPIMRFTAALAKTGLPCEVIGLRREESARRRGLPESFLQWSKRGKYLVWKYAPIIGWTSEDVGRYIRRHRLPVNPIYRLIDSSGECWCGVYKSRRELEIVAAQFPDWFERFVRLEESFRKGGSAFYFHGRRVRAEGIARRPRLTDFIRNDE